MHIFCLGKAPFSLVIVHFSNSKMFYDLKKVNLWNSNVLSTIMWIMRFKVASVVWNLQDTRWFFPEYSLQFTKEISVQSGQKTIPVEMNFE